MRTFGGTPLAAFGPFLCVLWTLPTTANAETATNSRDIAFPEFRFELYEKLDEATQTAAKVLNYVEDTWNVPGTAEIEFLSYETIEEQDKELVKALETIGFDNEEVYDCFMNHYNDYFWDEMEDDVIGYWETLGWSAESWEAAENHVLSEELDWLELSDAQQQAAMELCYLPETWSPIHLKYWISGNGAATCQDVGNQYGTGDFAWGGEICKNNDDCCTLDVAAFSLCNEGKAPNVLLDHGKGVPGLFCNPSGQDCCVEYCDDTQDATNPDNENTDTTGGNNEPSNQGGGAEAETRQGEPPQEAPSPGAELAQEEQTGGQGQPDEEQNVGLSQQSNALESDTSDQRLDCVDVTQHLPTNVMPVNNLATLKKPINRFYTWQSLSPEVRLVAMSLKYTPETWSKVLEAPIELTRYDDLTQVQVNGITSLGFGPKKVFDCWIHHYENYEWDELDIAGVQSYFHTLGWTPLSWQKIEPEPNTSQMQFDDLNEAQQLAVLQLCYTRESWNPQDSFLIEAGSPDEVTLAPVDTDNNLDVSRNPPEGGERKRMLRGTGV